MPFPYRAKRKDEELAKRILQYFLRNPQAADNLEGVTRWRLRDETVHEAVQSVSWALEWLVSRGYLQETVRTGAGRIFSLNQVSRSKAERFMAGKR